jgi:hypothetical protein
MSITVGSTCKSRLHIERDSGVHDDGGMCLGVSYGILLYLVVGRIKGKFCQPGKTFLECKEGNTVPVLTIIWEALQVLPVTVTSAPHLRPCVLVSGCPPFPDPVGCPRRACAATNCVLPPDTSIFPPSLFCDAYGVQSRVSTAT